MEIELLGYAFDLEPLEIALIMIGCFVVLIGLRVYVAFALAISCIVIVSLDSDLDHFVVIDRTFKAYDSFLLLAVPFFLMAANVMNTAGITDKMIKLSSSIVGHLPGGLGQINVLVSMIFAGVSGSSSADAAGIGKILIPSMQKEGYSTSFSVAITACSSVMGVIIPPSILMIIWGGVMSTSIGSLFLAGAVPGFTIALVMMITVYFYAKIECYPIHSKSSFRDFIICFKESIPALLTPLIIIGGIVGGFFTPTESSVIAVLYALAIGIFVYKSINFQSFVDVIYDTGRFSGIILICIGTASAFSWLLSYYEVPTNLINLITDYELTKLQTAFIIAGIFLITGLFIDVIPAIIILGTVLYPVAQSVGLHPVHFAIIGVVSLAFGLVTPPYGICLLISSSIGGISITKALRDVFIILIPMLLILIGIIVFPDFALALPKMVMPEFINN